MKRREFITLLGGAAAWPLATRAQQPMPVIGYLGSESPELFASRLRAFRQGLSRADYEEHRNVIIEYRWAHGRNEQLPALAADLIARGVAVLAAPGSVASTLAAKAATSTIPIVFEMGADPIALGVVSSLNRPGGNITGVTSLNAEVGPKRLELLHEVIPAAGIIGVLVNPTNPQNAEAATHDLQTAADAIGVRILVLNASTEADFDSVFAALSEQGAGGLVIANETFFAARSEQVGALAARHAMPAIHQSREFAAAGGLLSYGGNTNESHGQAGLYVGLILKGEKAGDLPVQRVTKTEMVVNLKAAAQLGISIPVPLLARADEVIE